MIKCYFCHKGHIKRNCPERKKTELRDYKKPREHGKADFSIGDDSYEYFETLVATNEKAMTKNTEKEDWVLGSGCTFHMTSNEKWFVFYKQWDGGSVFMGNNHGCKVVGIGDVMLKLEDNREILLKNVRHIPEIRRNLISIGMLDEIGCLISVYEGFLKVSKNSKTVLEAPKLNCLSIMKSVLSKDHVLIAQSEKDEEFELWHRKLSHISEGGLKELLKQGVATRIFVSADSFFANATKNVSRVSFLPTNF